MTNVATPRELEDEIERRGLQGEYVYRLGIVLWGGWGVNQPIEYDDIWELLRATPDQRIEAAQRVLQ